MKCSEMLREIRYTDNMQAKFKSTSTVIHRTIENDSNTKHVSSIEPTDAISEIRTEIASIQNTLADLTAFRLSVLGTTTCNEQPLAHSSPVPSTSYSSTHGCCVGNRTGAIPRQMSNASYHPSNNEKFWMFFSRVKNDVTEDEIRAMVAACLGTTDLIIVQKLVSNWIDLAQLPYISFKVGIDVKFRDRAMLPSTWPSGIYYREFREKCFTWRP